MAVEEITIRVDPEAARAYRTADAEARRKLDLLLSLRLHEIAADGQSLQELMEELRQKAAQRGMTMEILQSILHDT